MKKYVLVMAALSAFTFAPAAYAADFLPGSENFVVSGDPFTGEDAVSAFIGNEELSSPGTDRFIFQIGPETSEFIGLGSGSVTATFSSSTSTFFSFDSVTFNNGVETFIVPISDITSGFTVAGLSDVPIFSGARNILTVSYTAAGNASYGGNLTFAPTAPVPEPATWAMMLLGFAGVGFAMRRRRAENVRVRYAS